MECDPVNSISLRTKFSFGYVLQELHMPLSDTLIQFLQGTVKGLGPFGKQYVTPLRAFLSMEKEPEKIHEVLDRGFTIEFVSFWGHCLILHVRDFGNRRE